MSVAARVVPKKAKKIHVIEYSNSLLTNHALLQEMKENIANCEGYIVKKVLSPELIKQIKQYLESVASGSLPAWFPLVNNCPDFYRINDMDQRSYVKAKMLQFNFHPWNQNMFNMFEETKHIYQLKNILSGNDADAFFDSLPSDGHITRLAFQFYPKGGGCIKMHSDPVGKHQVTVPVVMMSKRGKDYHQGGGSVLNENDELINTDDLMDIGDMILFNAEVIHGVKPIDPETPSHWLDFQGRWILIASIIKTTTDNETPNSLQIEQ